MHKKKLINNKLLLISAFFVCVLAILSVVFVFSFNNEAKADAKVNVDYSQSNPELKAVSAPITQGQYKISSSASWSRVIDVPSASTVSGVQMQIYQHNGSNAQIFDLKVDDKGYYTIINKNSGLALDVSGAQALNLTPVLQYTPNGSAAQKWQILAQGSGYYIKSAIGNFVLDLYCANDSDGATLDIYTPNNSNAQIWNFTSSSNIIKFASTSIAAGNYVIGALASPSRALDIINGSLDFGANVQIFEGNRTDAQVFNLKYDEQGYYTITNKKSGNVLDVAGASTNSGANVWQYLPNNSLAQKWVIIKNADGFYSIHSALKMNLVLDIFCGADVNGANVDVYSANWTPAQKWLFYNPNPGQGAAGSKLLTEDWYNVVENSSNLVFDVPCASSSENVCIQLYGNNGTSAQQFNFIWASGGSSSGYYRISPACTNGLYLSCKNGSILPQTEVVTSRSTGDDTLWALSGSAGNFYIINKASGMYVSLNTGAGMLGSKVVCEYKSSAKTWSTKAQFGNGIFSIKPLKNTSKAIDIEVGSFNDGARAQTYTSNGSGAQSFVVTNLPDGSVDIRSCRSKKYLDVVNAQAFAGAAIQQYAGNNSAAQHWRLTKTNDGCYIISSAINANLVLDCGACADGTKLQLSNNTGSNSQKFKFEPSSYPDVWWSNNCWYIDQNPELPWGCESVALTELMTGVGYFDGKTAIAANYIPYSDWDFVHCYAGSPWNPPSGIGSTMPPCIADAGSRFLSDHGSKFRTNVATGTSLWDLLVRACAGYPSVVWTTIDLAPVSKYGNVIEGYQVYSNLHAVCLVGYDGGSDSVIVCDSLAGKVARPRAWFEDIYNQAGQYAVTID